MLGEAVFYHKTLQSEKGKFPMLNQYLNVLKALSLGRV